MSQEPNQDTNSNPQTLDATSRLIGHARRELGRVIAGQSGAIEEVLIAVLCQGHALLEGVPGIAKTLLVKALGQLLGLGFQRVQATPDLMPADILGTTILRPGSESFLFHAGPVFTDLLLVDEINRMPPRTQAALLECMEERQVTSDGVRRPLPSWFTVFATQNPVDFEGTYPLPEAQLDRFLMKTSLGYPDHASTVEILGASHTRNHQVEISPLITPTAVVDMAELAATVHIDPSVLEYVARIAEETRTSPLTSLGVSVRGCLALVRASKTWAAAHGRHFVVPDDVKALVEPVLAHRIMLDAEAEFAGTTVASVLGGILADIAPPERRG